MMTRLILATTPWSQVAIVAVLIRAMPVYKNMLWKCLSMEVEIQLLKNIYKICNEIV